MAQTDTDMIPIHEASQATAILFGKPMTAGELSNDDVAAVHAGFELEALIQSLNKYPETLEKAHNAIVIAHARKVSQWGSNHLHASLGAAQRHPVHTRAWITCTKQQQRPTEASHATAMPCKHVPVGSTLAALSGSLGP